MWLRLSKRSREVGIHYYESAASNDWGPCHQRAVPDQFRALTQPRLLLMLLMGALGSGSLFTVFTYITPLLEEVTGFSEHKVAWILVLFGFGVTFCVGVSSLL
ncbi:putative MFS family arabinose efflux permease [Paenibacillus sp. V4I3]|nr:putative MFS family arabinose efflux permease [Paenibacillus sp. V4I3]MDQ0891744.1 putative MFS family arabinose efflux permease [Paenibacillus sp. V4I9]